MHHWVQEYAQNLHDSKFLLKIIANLLGYLTLLFMQKTMQLQQDFYRVWLLFLTIPILHVH